MIINGECSGGGLGDLAKLAVIFFAPVAIFVGMCIDGMDRVGDERAEGADSED